MTWEEMIKDGYDPIPSMYPKILFARQNGKSCTDLKNLFEFHFNYDEPVRPLRAKGTDGLRAKVTLIDEWNEYCRHDIDVINRRLLYKTIIKNKKVKESMRNIPFIKNVIFNEPATIVFWSDDTKTVVKCQNEKFDPEKGLAMAIAKKALGNEHDYYGKNFGKWISEAAVKVEEKPKRMTFREEVAIKEPHRIDKYAGGGVCGCPRDGVYTSDHCRTMTCRQCWDREIPEEKPQEELKLESPTLQIGDKAVVIGNGCTRHNYKDGDIVRIVNRCISSDSMFVAIESRTDKNHPNQYIDKKNLKKLAADQTMRPGDLVVVVKKPSFLCGYDIGTIVRVRFVSKGVKDYNIIDCVTLDGDWYQRFKSIEAVKIVDDTPVEDSVLRAGDKAVKVHGENDDIDHHPLGAVLDVESANDKYEHVSTLGPTIRYPKDKISQNTYRTCLKKLAKDQTLRNGDKAVVIKKTSYACIFVPGDIITIVYVKAGGDIIAIPHPKSQKTQILKASEVVKIVE